VATADGLYLVEPSAATITPHEALDRTTRLASVTLDGVAGEKLESGNPLSELVDRAAVLAANDLAGIARKALSDTVEYDKTRVQFGKPVGSFQAIKHDLADIHLAVTMAEHAATYAAHAQDIDAPDKQLATSIAKAKAGDTASAATGAMIQYHGGIGYTWEHDAHFYLKRAKRLEYAFGDASQHRERIARLAVDSTSGRGNPHGGESGGMAVGTA
jgi:acyl-CoA dehydrogenase